MCLTSQVGRAAQSKGLYRSVPYALLIGCTLLLLLLFDIYICESSLGRSWSPHEGDDRYVPGGRYTLDALVGQDQSVLVLELVLSHEVLGSMLYVVYSG
jgi:hypothetical protein